MSIISEENNQQPETVYHSWGRWRIVKSVHEDERRGVSREQYTLQRHSDSKKLGRVYHMVAFFWSLDDLDDFISHLQDAADAIEVIDKDSVLRK